MTSQDARLNALTAAIDPNGEGEADFFRELLEFTVYAHIPPSGDSGRLRFIQLISPGGESLLPFFTDQTKARHLPSNRSQEKSSSATRLQISDVPGLIPPQ